MEPPLVHDVRHHVGHQASEGDRSSNNCNSDPTLARRGPKDHRHDDCAERETARADDEPEHEHTREIERKNCEDHHKDTAPCNQDDQR